MYRDDRFNPWVHYNNEAELYTKRAAGQVEEMTCHKQAAEELAPYVEPGDTLMDVGCASGFLYWSFLRRELQIDYYGIDITRRLIEIGRKHFCPLSGVPEDHLMINPAETLTGEYDITVCINTLYCLPNYHQPLERICDATRKVLYLRTLMDKTAEYRYFETNYPNMTPGYNHLKAYYNIYPLDEVMSALRGYGFLPRLILDQRNSNGDEYVRGKRYPWRCILAVRE